MAVQQELLSTRSMLYPSIKYIIYRYYIYICIYLSRFCKTGHNRYHSANRQSFVIVKDFVIDIRTLFFFPAGLPAIEQLAA